MRGSTSLSSRRGGSTSGLQRYWTRSCSSSDHRSRRSNQATSRRCPHLVSKAVTSTKVCPRVALSRTAQMCSARLLTCVVDQHVAREGAILRDDAHRRIGDDARLSAGRARILRDCMRGTAAKRRRRPPECTPPKIPLAELEVDAGLALNDLRLPRFGVRASEAEPRSYGAAPSRTVAGHSVLAVMLRSANSAATPSATMVMPYLLM